MFERPLHPSFARRAFWRRFIALLATNVALLGLVLGTVYREQAATRIAELGQVEERAVALQSETLASDFHSVISDLMTLAESGTVRGYLDDPTDGNRARVEQGFQLVADYKQVFDQIRLLDDQGMEVVRVNLVDMQGQAVPPEKLQNKRDRYYFREAAGLPPRQVFVSPLDLNVEDDMIEQPIKPTVRFATPVFDSAGERRGVLILNYLTNAMFKRFGRLGADSPGDSMLVNGEGYWLYGGDPLLEFGFMYPQRPRTKFQDHFPEAADRILGDQRGQFRVARGLFTFDTAYPLRGLASSSFPTREGGVPQNDAYFWKIVSRVSPDVIAQRLAPLRQISFLLAGSAVLLMGVGSLAVARYATDRELSQASLRESEARFRQMAETIAEVFWLRSADCRRLIYVSPAFASVWGRDAATLEEAHELWWEGIHPDDRRRVHDAVSLGIAHGEFSKEYRVTRPSGEIRWILDRGFAVRDSQGKIQRFAGIADDITDLRAAQDRLLQAERLAAMGEAVTGLAHESRNALQRGQVCLEMLSKRIADRPEAADLARRIQDALRDLYRLYERLKVYAGPMNLDRGPIDLQALWRRTIDDVADLIRSRNAAIREECLNGVEATFFGDDLAVRQVFRNILENALSEELDSRSERDRVEVQATWNSAALRGAPAIELVVRDNGPGVPPEQLARLFEPFFSTKTRGTGLGLAICRRIVEAHDGQIEAHSEPGKGFQIRILFPRAGL